MLIINPEGKLVDQLQGSAYERAVNETFGEIAGEVLVDDIIEMLRYKRRQSSLKTKKPEEPVELAEE